jgi:hypothetical protein
MRIDRTTLEVIPYPALVDPLVSQSDLGQFLYSYETRPGGL